MVTTARHFARRVAHLTSVHAATDPRILHKECATLAANGYDVVLIAQHDVDEVRHGVRIRAVRRASNRIARMTLTAWRVLRAAIEEDCDVYHFHDPELIPIALLLRLRGKPVIYDIHEDYRTSIQQKAYLPPFLRRALAAAVGRFEELASAAFHQVLAERYYIRRFPAGCLVLNYPLHTQLGQTAEDLPRPQQTVRLLYTGGITADRGALIHAALVRLDEAIEVHMIGRCSPALAARLRAIAGDEGQSRLFITGEGRHVEYEQILDAYRTGGWTAGLALFPPTPHYREKELTKFFEYMAAGIPILCSDFPVWKSLMEESGCGLAVDPSNRAQVTAAVAKLAADHESAVMMARRGRAAVASRYNWGVQADSLLSLYDSVVAGPHRVA